MKIVENWSRIHGRVEDWRAADAAGGAALWTIRVEGVEPVARPSGGVYPSFLQGSLGQVLRVRVPARAARQAQLARGMRIVLAARRGRTPDLVFADPARIELLAD